jgi:hypothetical protein
VSTTLVVHLELGISLEIIEENLNGINGILRGLEEIHSWKNLESNISLITIAAGVVDTGGVPWLANISATFWIGWST